MAIGLPMGLGAAMEAVALHHAGEAAALRQPAHVNQVAGLEDLRPHLLAHLPLRCVIDGELAQMAEVPQPLQMTLQRLIHPLGHPKTELDSAVAVLLRALDLDNRAGAGLDHGNGVNHPLAVEDLGHADLPAEQAPDTHCSLISISTPAGNCSLISVSTVFDVGSRISISRL